MQNNALSGADRSDASSADWYENAVLVFGPRKSGTTLLHNLLDGDPGMFVYPEEVKLKRLVGAEADGRLDAALYRQFSRIFKVELPRFDAARYASGWDAAVASGGKPSLKRLIRTDVDITMASLQGAAPPAPRQWCAKEVGNRQATAVVEWWLKSFARPRVVFILREPGMVTRAVLNDRRRKGIRLPLGRIVHETLDPIRVLLAQEKLLHRPGVVAITYEDLVADPAGTMRKVARFLDLPLGLYLDKPSIFGAPVVVRTASRSQAGVFADAAKWSDGLTARERWIVAATRFVARFLPGLRLDYAALAAKTRAGRD